MPFEQQIDVGSFSIRVPVADMARIPEILAAHDDKVEEYRGRIAAVASRYEWRFQRFLASNRTAYFLDGIIRVSDSRPLDPGTYKTRRLRHAVSTSRRDRHVGR